MKLVKAIIRPSKLPDVLRALYQAKITGLTVSNVRGHGGEVKVVETYRGTTAKMELKDKIMIDIGVSDEFVETAIEVICDSAHTGHVGDGKIFVQPVERIIRVRTREEDMAAVTPVR
ncbi:MAG: P-II family nitrogen regulator [Bacteroidetes bacterium]|nr:P-II family nitrogen regulator [Bacteroidota bacterium]MCY4225780.1 P-II family nitrogen regulator [Bacteroidota bacterium]